MTTALEPCRTAPPPRPAFRLTFGDLGLMVLAMLGGAAGLAVVALLARRFLGLDLQPLFGTQGFVFVSLLLQATIMVGAVWLFGLRRRTMSWHDIGLRPISRRWLLAAGLIALACVPVVSLVTAGFQLALDKPISSPQARAIAPEGFTWPGVVGMLALGGLAAPFAEELVFRGVLYRLLRGAWGIAAAVALSAALFSVVHGILDVIPGTFLIGVVLALLYERSGSLWVPFTLHAVFNSLSMTVMFVSLAFDLEIV